MRNLLALFLNMLLALRTGGVSMASVSRFGLSVSLSVSISTGDDLGVVSNNGRAVVNLLVCGLTVLGDDVLALLSVGGVNNGVVLLVALLVNLDVVLGVAVGLLVAIGITTMTRWGAVGTGGQAEDSNKSEHFDKSCESFFPAVCYR